MSRKTIAPEALAELEQLSAGEGTLQLSKQLVRALIARTRAPAMPATHKARTA